MVGGVTGASRFLPYLPQSIETRGGTRAGGGPVVVTSFSSGF